MTNEIILAPDGWLKARPVGPETWAIDDNGQDTIYLVAGRERCLLVDTGWGIGDLPALVASLSPLPVVVVNSHAHPDHATGNGQFRAVHVGRADAWMASKPLSVESRRFILDGGILRGPFPPSFTRETWAAKLPESLVPVDDGHGFDLGGRVIQAITTPGHSRGSLCLLDRAGRQLLTGDSALGGGIWMHLEESTTLREYLASLRKLQSYAAEFDVILPAHGQTPMPRSIIDDLAAGVEAVIEGRVVGEPHQTFAGEGLRCDFGSCGVVYRPDRLG